MPRTTLNEAKGQSWENGYGKVRPCRGDGTRSDELHRLQGAARKPHVKPQELVRMLEADGWYSTGQTGSRRPFRHPVKPGLLVVPMHAGEKNRQRIAPQYPEEGGAEMTREYLVVYERGATNWSAFAPDLPGCGSLGDELEDTRSNMREAVELNLHESAKAGEPIPGAIATKVDFHEFDPNHEAKQSFVEWLAVTLPESIAPSTESQAA